MTVNDVGAALATTLGNRQVVVRYAGMQQIAGMVVAVTVSRNTDTPVEIVIVAVDA